MTEKPGSRDYCDEHKMCLSDIKEVKEVQDKQWTHINEIEKTRPTTKGLFGFAVVAVTILMGAFAGVFNQNSNNAQKIDDSHRSIMTVTTNNDERAQKKIDDLKDIVSRMDERIKKSGNPGVGDGR